MHHLVKELLVLDSNDSLTVQQLKLACNQLIEQYNLLDNPLQDKGHDLVTQINTYIMKVHQLKDLHYETNR
jgi:hypothetical protein